MAYWECASVSLCQINTEHALPKRALPAAALATSEYGMVDSLAAEMTAFSGTFSREVWSYQ